MKLCDLIERKDSRRTQVRDLLLTRNRKARNAQNPEMPEFDGGSSKGITGKAQPPNVQTTVSDLVPHSL